jgi:hypothetical protein
VSLFANGITPRARRAYKAFFNPITKRLRTVLVQTVPARSVLQQIVAKSSSQSA